MHYKNSHATPFARQLNAENRLYVEIISFNLKAHYTLSKGKANRDFYVFFGKFLKKFCNIMDSVVTLYVKSPE